jgi:hypothetical protein
MRFFAFLLALMVATSARGVTVVDPQVPPPGLAPGSIYHRLFVTGDSFGISNDTTYPPVSNVGGLAGGDFQVTLAWYQGGGIPDWDGEAVPFRAILSDGVTNAKDRLTIKGPIYNLANELVANNAADLWDGTIAHAVRYDEYGQSVNEGTRVWTGTNGLGAADPNCCGNWFNPSSFGSYGNPNAIGFNWLVWSGQNCSNSARLYGLSPALSVPLDGDINDDDTVDAADYVAWRNGAALPADYALWRTHFGDSIPGAAASATTSVPEPTTLLLAALLLPLLSHRRPACGLTYCSKR